MDLRAIAHNSDVISGTHDFGLAQWNFIVAHGDLFGSPAVQHLGLHEDDWVRVAHRRQQQTLGLQQTNCKCKLNK